MAEETAVPVILSFHENRMRPIVVRALPLIGKLLHMQRGIGFTLPGLEKSVEDFFVMAFPYAGPIGVSKNGVVHEEGDFFCLIEKSAHAAYEREELTLGQVLADALTVVCVQHKLVDGKVSVMFRNRMNAATVRAYFLGSTTTDMAVMVVQALFTVTGPSIDEAQAVAESELKRIMNKREA